MDINLNKPVIYYHVPRCAGTYALGYLRTVMLVLQKKLYSNLGASARHVMIYDEDNTCIARIFGIEKIRAIPNNNVIKQVPNRPSLFYIYFKDCEPSFFEHVMYVSFIIEPRGISIYKEILNKIFDYENMKSNFRHCITLRPPLDHAISMYNYLNSNVSKHEPTHKAFGNIQLEEYLTSHHTTDSWIIRQFNNLKDNEPITEEIFLKTCHLLDKFEVIELDNLNNFLAEFAGGLKNEIDLSKMNKNCSKKYQFTIDNQEILDIFKQKTFWDQKLYDKYCK